MPKKLSIFLQYSLPAILSLCYEFISAEILISHAWISIHNITFKTFFANCHKIRSVIRQHLMPSLNSVFLAIWHIVKVFCKVLLGNLPRIFSRWQYCPFNSSYISRTDWNMICIDNLISGIFKKNIGLGIALLNDR